MKKLEWLIEENEEVKERYDLASERVSAMLLEQTVEEPYRSFFRKAASFCCMMGELYEKVKSGEWEQASLLELEEQNETLYADILPGHYDSCYANPAFAVERLGEEYGRLFSFLYTELRGMIAFAYEERLYDITILLELLIEIYNMFEGQVPAYKEVRQSIYWFVSDYCDHTVTGRIREQLDASLTFAVDLVMESDLTDLRYLYQYGEYITSNEIQTARFLNSLPQEEIDAMASTYTEGFVEGFALAGIDLSRKKYVNIRYNLGFERMVRAAIQQFASYGLMPILFRPAVSSINKRQNIKSGYTSTSPNKQFDYDHRFDNALYLDKALNERKLAVTRVAYESYKKEAAAYAGPAVIEIFGETPFEPVNKESCLKLSEKQQALWVEQSSQSSQITNEYIRHDEYSFTIIAYPVPEIGSRYEEIFREIVKVNTLDKQLYRRIQQAMIDALDQAVSVRVVGKGNNHTDITVAMHELKDPSKETNFENCLADVNIPVGEVFTSPKLQGTNGVVHVSEVYLHDLKYVDLSIRFENGIITDYSCRNFDTEAVNQSFIRENLLQSRETLPLGEFAIGTNTTAYVMANRYDIVYKLPILIVEKMGPHFAVGDTCYSFSEENRVYNPDGKEIVAKDNEYSLLRSEDLSKAYFNCHTDITIPYDELGAITAILADGSELPILMNGRFVLPGTLELNKPFKEGDYK